MANPYLDAQAGAITNQVNQNLKTNILPSIGSGAVQAGGYGGSRQGVAEGLAIGQTNQGLSNSLANLYGTNYQQDQSNDIQRQAVGNQYNLGLGSLGLQNQNQNFNFYTQQRGLDQSGAQLGADLFNGGNAGYMGQGTGITGIGNTQQQAPWNVLGNGSNIFNQYTGLGGSTVQTATGSPLGGAIGGALGGAQIGRNLGFGGGYGGAQAAFSQTGLGGSGYGTGLAYGNQDLGGYL